MKPFIKFLLLSLILTISSCQNDDDDTPPIEQLPPATMTGENTFGCLINGEAFIDIGPGNNFYQQVNGEFFFLVGGLSDETFISQVLIASNGIEVDDNQDYILSCNEPNSYYAELSIRNTFLDLQTCDTSFGNFFLTKFDLNTQVASGTFEFDVIDPRDNTLVEVREGRFDVTFTR